MGWGLRLTNDEIYAEKYLSARPRIELGRKMRKKTKKAVAKLYGLHANTKVLRYVYPHKEEFI